MVVLLGSFFYDQIKELVSIISQFQLHWGHSSVQNGITVSLCCKLFINSNVWKNVVTFHSSFSCKYISDAKYHISCSKFKRYVSYAIIENSLLYSVEEPVFESGKIIFFCSHICVRDLVRTHTKNISEIMNASFI